MTPFFQASRRSLAYQFTVNAPLLWPPFSIFRKFLDFQPCFSQNSSSLNPNFSKFSFPRPPFFKENPLPRPYILKPAWHTSTKKKLSAPPPPGQILYTQHRLSGQDIDRGKNIAYFTALTGCNLLYLFTCTAGWTGGGGCFHQNHTGHNL